MASLNGTRWKPNASIMWAPIHATCSTSTEKAFVDGPFLSLYLFLLVLSFVSRLAVIVSGG